jgi:hypothetical protein
MGGPQPHHSPCLYDGGELNEENYGVQPLTRKHQPNAMMAPSRESVEHVMPRTMRIMSGMANSQILSTKFSRALEPIIGLNV